MSGNAQGQIEFSFFGRVFSFRQKVRALLGGPSVTGTKRFRISLISSNNAVKITHRADSTRILCCCAILFAFSFVPVCWAGVTPRLSVTIGPDGYRGYDVSSDIAVPLNYFAGEKREGSFHVRPGIATYKSDLSPDTRIYRGSVGMENQRGSFNLNAQQSPEVDGYKMRAWGADISANFPRGDGVPVSETQEEEHAASTVKKPHAERRLLFSVIAGFLLRDHEDRFAVATGTAASAAFVQSNQGKGRGGSPNSGSSNAGNARGLTGTVLRPIPIQIRQTDVFAGVGARWEHWQWSERTTLSSYNKDLEQVDAIPPGYIQPEGLNAAIQGFPEWTVETHLSWEVTPWFTPALSFSRTRLKLGAPDFISTGIETEWALGDFRFEAAFARYSNVGSSHGTNYYTAALSRSF